jgi:hypothetical protein
MLAVRKADLTTLRLAVKFKEKSRDNLPRLSLWLATGYRPPLCLKI